MDTSVWVDHFRRGDATLTALLRDGLVLIHPFVIGELALGTLRDWHDTVATLQELPQADVVSQDTYLALIDDEELVATGLGFVDTHLLASTRHRPGVHLWTKDKRLAARADTMGIGWIDQTP